MSENPTRSWPGTTSNTPATRRRFAYDRDLFHAVAEASAAIEAPHFDRTNRSQSRGSGAATALGLADAALVADDGTLLAYTVTHADLHYVGSVTIDADLMDAADLLDGEQVTIVDIDNGARLVTYAITGERGTGIIGINGAAAHLVHPGDLVILIAYGTMTDAEAREYQPRIVFVDAANRQVDLGSDPAKGNASTMSPVRRTSISGEEPMSNLPS